MTRSSDVLWWLATWLFLCSGAAAQVESSATASNCGAAAIANNGATVTQTINCYRQTEAQAAAESENAKRFAALLSATRKDLQNVNEQVRGLRSQLSSQHEDQKLMDKLRAELSQKEGALRSLETTIAEQEQGRASALKNASLLRRQLANLGARLVKVEHDRVTPRALDWMAFASAAVGCGVAIAAEIASNNFRQELQANLASENPALTQQQADSKAAALDRTNVIGRVALLTWGVGSLLGMYYMERLLRDETPLPNSMHVDIAPGQLGLQVSGRWNSM